MTAMGYRQSSEMNQHFQISVLMILIGVILLPTASCTTPHFTTHTYPVTVFFAEESGTPSGTVLHTFHAEDDEAGVVPFLNYTFDPTSGSAMFDITETNTGTERTAVVTLKDFKQFDYETQDTFKITAYAFDGVILSDGVLLTIQVNDTGETPYLSPATDHQSFVIEESSLGTVIGHPNFVIVDTDGSEDYHVWTITGGTGQSYVSVNPNNGTIVLATDYDRENVAHVENIYVDISITDKFGLSVTTTYSILITDKNDNIPICNPTDYTFNVSHETQIDTILANITCTDADLTSPNNEITYSLDPDNVYADYFAINGSDIILAYNIDLIYGGGPYVVLVQATDGGTPAYTSTVTVTYSLPASTTLPPTTTLVPNPAYDALSSDPSLPALFVLAAIIGACIVGYILILCWRWNTFGECLPRHCPTSRDCRMCCTCCPGDDIKLDAVVANNQASTDFVLEKGDSLGPEAASSRKPSRVK